MTVMDEIPLHTDTLSDAPSAASGSDGATGYVSGADIGSGHTVCAGGPAGCDADQGNASRSTEARLCSASGFAFGPGPFPPGSLEECPLLPEDRDKRDALCMELALDQARAAAEAGEVPIGAVVAYQPIDRATRRPTAPPRLIACGRNRRETDRDPAAHAEFLAMEEASRMLDAWRLTDCTVYVTLEPCIMCAGLMHQSRVSRCVFGACDPKAGALGTLYAIHEDTRLNHRFEVTPGILADQCADELRSFFAKKRKS